MKKSISVWTVLVLFISSVTLSAQKVGLVLSGGGAKGVAHVGMLQAFEENNIPIDYISGTSIGAIVGSLYAMGYSPKEMLQLFRSPEFRRWQTGEIEKGKMFYYKQPDPTPEFFTFSLKFQDSAKVKTNFLPYSIINPAAMNMAFVKLFSQASAYCDGNFNKLFVPFRCVASDVSRKRAVYFGSGDLGFAVRTSMSIPILFRPLRKDSIVYFDGGIYDNFPVDVMMSDFNPDYIIGSAVFDKSTNPTEDDFMKQLEAIVITKSTVTLPEDKSALIYHDMSKIGMMEFESAMKAYDIGYRNGLKYVEAIRQKVHRSVTSEELTVARQAFKNRFPAQQIGTIQIEGVDSSVKSYIMRQFARYRKDGVFSFDELEEVYFGLLSDAKIKEIYPTVHYNKESQLFDLNLRVKLSDDIIVSFGGLVSSSNSSQAYLGVAYQSIFYNETDYHLNAHIGNQYNSLSLSGRIIFPSNVPFYLMANAVATFNKFSEGERLFYESDLTSYFESTEMFFRLRAGLPIHKSNKLEITSSYGRITDRYVQNITNLPTTSQYDFFNTSILTEKNTLNLKMYPYKGTQFQLKGQHTIGHEMLRNDLNTADSLSFHRNWVQLSLNYSRYFELHPNFFLGGQVNLTLSNKPFFENYTSTIIQAPAFTPTPHSQIVFNESLHANNFLALGIKPIYRFDNGIQIRAEIYGFLPYQKIMSDLDSQPYHAAPFRNISGFGELAVVYGLPIGSISLYADYYSFPKNNFNFGLNIGILLRNPKFID